MAGGTEPVPSLHASCVVLGEAGILIVGPSGSGKSTLARHLVTARTACGGFARHVADDRVEIESRAGRLLVRPVPTIAGMLEIRGIGLVEVGHEPACRVRLVVELGGEPDRMPEPDGRSRTLCGVPVPLLRTPLRDAQTLVEWQIRVLGDTFVTE